MIDGVDAVGAHRGEHLEVAAGLGGRVGRARPQGVVLARGVARLDVAVDLVGRDVDEAAAAVADPLEQEVRAEDVGLDEVAGLHDRAVDVRLGGEVDDRVAALGRARDRIGVADRAVHEAVALVVGDVGQVGRVAGVRERVEVHDLDVVMAPQQPPHEMRADEPAAAGHEDPSHVPSALARAARQSRSPSLQCGSRGASAWTVRRIEQAGRGAGRCSSLERDRLDARGEPASSMIALAKPCQLVEPPPARW